MPPLSFGITRAIFHIYLSVTHCPLIRQQASKNEKGIFSCGFIRVRACDVWPIIFQVVVGVGQSGPGGNITRKTLEKKTAHSKKGEKRTKTRSWGHDLSVRREVERSKRRNIHWFTFDYMYERPLWIDACLAECRETIVDVISNWSNGGADIRAGVGEAARGCRRSAESHIGAPEWWLVNATLLFQTDPGLRWLQQTFHLHMVFLSSRRPECCHFTSICNTSLLLLLLISSFPAQAQLFPCSTDTQSLPSFHPSWTHLEAGRRRRASQSDHNDSAVVNSQSPSCILFFVVINRPPQFGGYDSMWLLKICCFLSKSFSSSSIIETWPVIPINQLEQKFVVSLVDAATNLALNHNYFQILIFFVNVHV